MIIDTCTNLKNVTGFTNCAGPDKEKEALEKIHVQVKLSTQFFSPQTYLNIGYMQSQFRTFIFTLEEMVSRRESFAVSKTDVSFQNSYIYASPLTPKQHQTYYVLAYALGETNQRKETFSQEGLKYSVLSALLNIQFKQGQAETEQTVVRVNFVDLFMQFGGFMALTLRFTYYLIGEF